MQAREAAETLQRDLTQARAEAARERELRQDAERRLLPPPSLPVGPMTRESLLLMPPELLASLYESLQTEVQRLRAVEVALSLEVGTLRGRVEASRSSRSRSHTISHRSHATSQRSQPSRPREGEGESGGPGPEGGAES